MKRLFLLLPLILVLVTSGCTIPGTDIQIPGIPDIFGSQVTESRDDIIIIKNLQVTPATTISSGQTLLVYADVQSLESTIGEKIKVDVEMYDYCTNLFESVTPNCPSGEEKTEKGCNIELMPQEIKTIKWTLVPNKDNIKLATSCELKLKAEYDYSTDTVTQITYIDPTELAARIRRGESWRTAGTSSIGEGPVKPYLSVEDQQPVSSELEAQVKLVVKNVGNGYLAIPEGETEPMLKKDSKIINPENINWKDDCEISDDYRKLIGRETPPLLCTLEAPGSSVGIETTYDIRAEISYRYAFRKSIKINIEPLHEIS